MTRDYISRANLSDWIDLVLRRIKPDKPLAFEMPSLPDSFTRLTQALLIDAMRYGRWLAHSYIQEIRALYGVKRDGDAALKKKWGIKLLSDSDLSSDWHEVLPSDAIEWVKTYTPVLAESIETGVRERVRDVIRDALMSGESIRETKESLRSVLGNMTDARLQTIARTEITRADTMGRLIEYKTSEDVDGVEFSAILDDRTTEICNERHGLVMRLDDPRLPENSPPLHPNCRSVLLAITAYDRESGWVTSPEFDDVPDSMQRESDVETVRKVLKQGEAPKQEKAKPEEAKPEKVRPNTPEDNKAIFDALGINPGKPMSIEDALVGANPNYEQSEEYKTNCQRCVQVYELRRRGYDVEALPDYIFGISPITRGNECFIARGASVIGFFTGDQTAAAVQQELNNAPTGSRYIIYVKWHFGGAHVFNAEKLSNGVVRYIDPQIANTDVSEYFSLGTEGHFGYYRVDDKDITRNTGAIAATAKARTEAKAVEPVKTKAKRRKK